LKELEKRGSTDGVTARRMNFLPGLRHVDEPRHEPEEADRAEEEEERTPAKPGDEESTEKKAKPGTEEKTGAEHGIGETAVIVGKIESQNFAIRRIGDRLAEAEQQAQSEEQGEGMNESREGGGDRPKREAGSEDEVDVETIHQPSGNQLGEAVGPEESGEEEAEARGGEGEFILEKRCGDGEIAAVDVVDEDGNSQEDKGDEETRRDTIGRSSGESRHDWWGHDSAGEKRMQAGSAGRSGRGGRGHAKCCADAGGAGEARLSVGMLEAKSAS